jgi:aspartyl-tRNA(Asn)/glutamyl-tRNA(Gln) amidotransferase subunit B
MDYEIVIGLEVHCQLRTVTKMFCPCAYTVGGEPNTQIDPYTLGLPGTLPVPNRAAVDAALRLALALGCEIQPRSRWARKHYFYPDLPKGYQITQADQPYALGGALEIPDRERPTETFASKSIPLQRIHIEEDAGKSSHVGDRSLIDYNRAGVPLVEIVSLPVLRSAVEAADYMRELRTLVRYLGISEANMEEGTMRCDANVSLRPRGETELGVRCEIKNLNSFRFLESAIDAEVRRQLDARLRARAQPDHRDAHQGSRGRLPLLPRARHAALADRRRLDRGRARAAARAALGTASSARGSWALGLRRGRADGRARIGRVL